MKSYYLRTLLLLVVLAIFPFILFSQPANQLYKEVAMPAPTPASLGKYVDIPVSHHTGVPNISIPIESITEGPLSLNISLNYYSSGVRLDEVASWAGLGWSLDAGGMITRMVAGAPDEGSAQLFCYSDACGSGWYDDFGMAAKYNDPSCVTNPNNHYGYALDPTSCFAHYLDAAQGSADTEPDIFTFNFNGYSGKFLFDASRGIQMLPDQDLKIEVLNYTSGNFDSWKITAPDGTKYFFGGAGATENVWSDPSDLGYTNDETLSSTTWYLTRIESHDGHHWINFSYVNEKYGYPDRLSHTVGLDHFCVAPTGALEIGPVGLMINSVDGYRLSQITTGKGYVTVDFIALGLRQDLTKFAAIGHANEEAARLSRIKVTSGTWVKNFDLGHSYFTTGGNTPNFDLRTTTDKKRLRLDYLRISGSGVTLPDYQFFYNSQELGRRLSWGRDEWGYYNGADNNQGLIPNFEACYDHNYVGLANRAVNETKMKAGILEKITYPTGGSTELYYEAHREQPNSTKLIGGLRVKQIIDRDNQGSPPVVRDFVYGTGIVYAGYPQYLQYPYNNPQAIGNNLPDIGPIVSSSPIPAIKNTQGYHIGYSVVEINYGDNGRSVYRYTNLTPTPSMFFPPAPTQEVLGSGLLYQEEHYDADNQLVKNTVFTHAVESAGQINGRKVAEVHLLNPPPCDPPNFTEPLCSHRSLYSNYYVQLGRVLLTKKEDMLDGVTAITTYGYATLHNNPVSETVVNSDGVAHERRISYAYERGDTYMINANMVSIPMGEEKLTGGALAGGYAIDFSSGNPVIYKEILSNGSQLTRGQISGYQGGYPNDYQAMGFAVEDYDWTNGRLTGRHFIDWHRAYEHYAGTKKLKTLTEIDGQRVDYSYDGLGRLQSVASREGNVVTTYTYIFGAPNKIITQTVYSDAPTQTIEEEFDGLGRPKRTKHNGVVKKEQYYDHHGRVFKETWLPGNYITYDFDLSPLNRIVKRTYPDYSATYTRFGSQGNYYDVESEDEKGNKSHVISDILGRLHKTRDALNGETEYFYDPRSNLFKVQPPIGPYYFYEYDVRNRMVSKTIPGAETQYLRYYDSHDLLQFSVDGSGNRQDYEYDAYGREWKTRLATGVVVDLNSNYFGSPGDMIKENTYGESYGNINIGRLLKNKALMLNGTGTFVQTEYGYDPYGRAVGQSDSYQLDGVNISDNWSFGFNQADWQTYSARQHSRGAAQITVANTLGYDNFGREILHIFGADQAYAMAVTKNYNDRDELILKKYGSLGGYAALEKTIFKYTPRGWLQEMNSVIPRKSDWLFYTRPTEAVPPREVHEEAEISLEELLDRIAAGEDVLVRDLDPCANGDCYEQLASYRVSFDLGRTRNNGIEEVVAGGIAINLPNYPYLLADSVQFIADLGNWLTANGYVFSQIRFYEQAGETPGGAPTHIGWVEIIQTNLHFAYIRDTKAIKHNFTRYNVHYAPCKNLLHNPIGEASQQAGSVAALDAAMPSVTPTTLNYPALLYKVYLPGIGTRWVFKSELPILQGPYSRLDRVQIGSSAQTFEVVRNDGSKATLTLGQLLGERLQGTLKDIVPKEETNNEEECNLEPLGCTPYEQQQQDSSLALIMNQMANLDVQDLAYPDTLYLVQLCDGSTVYVLGYELLQQLLGPYIIRDELVLTGPEQTLSVVIVKRDPLFAMDFSYEPNGNIKKAKWKVTHHNVKFYQYAYDALNRLTNAEYGDIYLEENPANGTLSYQELLTNTYKGYGYSYDAIGNLLTLNRYGVVGGPDCEWGIIDQLSYTYDSQIAHLTNVADSAPLPGRDKGFKPKPGAGAYLYDDNGNMRIDPHKNLTITYNFLNLPSQIVKSGAGGGGTLSFTYDAMGRKWRKQGAGETRDYCQGIEYKDGKLEAVYGPEGRLTAVYDQHGVSLTHYRAEYWLKDHLGNTRLAFSDENHDGAIDTYDNPNTPENESEVLQENHYYPFGLNHEGPWYGGIGPENKYQYNGKELNEDFGLNWYDFGARWQDPAIGRLLNIDPLAEKWYSFSSYGFALNNPVLLVDPNGEDVYLYYWVKSDKKEDNNMFYQAALTRALDALDSGEMKEGDIYRISEIEDLGTLEDKVKSDVCELSSIYGETREFGLWSHAGKLDGPMGSKPTSKYAQDTYHMSQEGWSKIDFNWAKKGPTKAAFYGCNTGRDPDGEEPKASFTTNLSAMNNFRNVFVWGQTSSSYPSIYTNVRENNRAMMNGSFTTPTYMVAAGSLGIYGRFFSTSTPANPMRISRNGIGVAYNEIGQPFYQPGRKKKRK